MKGYCFECKEKKDYSIRENIEEDVINGVRFSMKQQHAFCNECGSEILLKDIIDKNTSIAHDAYRSAIGSITVFEMNEILETYNISPRPLSQLLGWGENTIERQMKHTIPDKEHSAILKGLMNPLEMIKILIQNSERISPVALRKALTAAMSSLSKLISAEETHQKDVISFQSEEKQYKSVGTISVGQSLEKQERKFTPRIFDSQPNAFKSSPFDSPYAA